MEVKMNKEIRDYQESMFFGLNFRQCAFSVLAILAAVAIYFGTKGRLPDDVQGWLCMLGAAPFAACGFFKYHGMTAEQFLWAFIKSEILYPKKLSFRPENLYYSCMEESILAGERIGGDGTCVTRKKENVAKKKTVKVKGGGADAGGAVKEGCVELTKNEQKILLCLAKKRQSIVTRDEIISSLWDSEMFVDDNTLTVNVNRLRAKLEETGIKDAILTKRGQGYLLV